MLDRKRSYKPLDFGNGLVAGSVNDQGRLVSLNTYQPEHGYVTLTNLPPFPNDQWYDPAFVRNYRAEQASPTLEGFGLSFELGQLPLEKPVCSLETSAMPLVQYDLAPGVQTELLTFAPFLKDNQAVRVAIQLCNIESKRTKPLIQSYVFSGKVSLSRASYAQLTEGGPIPIPPNNYQTAESEGIFTLENSNLACAIAIMVAEVAEDGTIHKAIAGWQLDQLPDSQKLWGYLSGRLNVESNRKVRLAIIYGLGANSDEARNSLLSIASHNLDELREDTERRWQAVEEIVRDSVDETAFPGATWLVRQALVYILACCAVPLENGSTCLITDHQLLPLAWTRDAYYAVQALLALRKQAQTSGSANAQNVITILDNIVRQHLIWLFEVAERPQGFWGRAYLTTGQCKDLIFQLDQQCYPLIELADYVEATGDKALALRLKPQLEEVLADLLARRAGAAWLFPTGETPADDKVEMPYHFSSQIVVWYSLKRLAELDILESHNPVRLREMAKQVRQDIYRYMVAENQGQKIFCYLTDLNGNYRFYHDANDWPTVLASTWGFCAVDDPIWQATLAFGFSPANQGGFYPGKVGGLGSVHTPHPWPLGDIQELFLVTLLKDETRRVKCWSKLRQISAWDGAFPEAYDENSGQVASRHWFAWPGAMLAASIQSTHKSVNINR